MINLWKIFGLKPDATIESLDKAYIELRSGERYDKDKLRLYWKMLRDPFYGRAVRKYHDPKIIEEAGFFDDGSEPEDLLDLRSDPRMMTTPVHKIINQIKDLPEETRANFSTNPPIILLTTGAFCPIHEGHLMMMENAKKELESRGKIVVGGYISPSHDTYVFKKYKDTTFFDAPHRLYLCEKAVAYSDWLMVDNWEVRYNEYLINFTDVLRRLENYLKFHLPEIPLKIYYVFGGDNAAFARTFINKGGCVCVKRPSHEDRMLKIKHDPYITSNNEIVIVDAFFDQPSISSSEIRSQQKPPLPAIEPLFDKWYNHPVHSFDLQEKKYAIRVDYQWSTQIWENINSRYELTIANIEFLDKFSKFLENSFSTCSLPDQRSKVKVQPIDLGAQKEIVEKYNQENEVINLDACTEGKYNLGFSRHFGISDGQCRWEHLVNRPGNPSIEEQFSKIEAGKYVLLDDDIATGFTVNTLLKLAPPTIEIIEKNGLLQKYLEKYHEKLKLEADDLVDINDLRDFMVGTRGSGLVVSLPNGELCRAPYLLPYVSMISRGSLPPSMELQFSLQIWQLNISYHQSLGAKIKLKDCEPSFVTLMKYLEFDDETLLVDICRWHLDFLKRLVRK
ncbi:hypothetical protein HYV64_00830 [Candidatus Shapirobacteria bacterium]|nr:hypothetical protein [Candidatus Shapirobacteria bacterium]